MVYLHSKFHLLRSRTQVVIGVKAKVKWKFHASAVLLFQFIQIFHNINFISLNVFIIRGRITCILYITYVKCVRAHSTETDTTQTNYKQ